VSAHFTPVPLPDWQSDDRTLSGLEDVLRRWATSPPLRALAEASGWAWPQTGDTLGLLRALADLSADWDFRGRRERDFISRASAVVNGREIPDDLVLPAARALGLVAAGPLPGRSFSHLVVLSGLVAACVNRTHHAAALLRGGLPADSVVVLGAHRPLSEAESDRLRELDLGDAADEADVIVAATRRSFGLGPGRTIEDEHPAGLPHAARARYQWPGERVEVVIAPSSEPEVRRANTVDQLTYWADLAGIGDAHSVLLVTTQIYVPFQHLDALRVLSLARGCAVYSCGVDATSSLLPAKQFAGRDYLQEIRSALRASAALLAAASEAGSAPRAS
jgi:hypothetical protein